MLLHFSEPLNVFTVSISSTFSRSMLPGYGKSTIFYVSIGLSSLSNRRKRDPERIGCLFRGWNAMQPMSESNWERMMRSCCLLGFKKASQHGPKGLRTAHLIAMNLSSRSDHPGRRLTFTSITLPSNLFSFKKTQNLTSFLFCW